MTERGDRPRARSTWWREVAITATAFGLCLFGGVVRDDAGLSPPSVTAYVIAIVSCVVLPLRHRAPVVVMAVTTAAGMAVAPLGLLLSPLIVAPVVIAAYSLAVHTARGTAATAVLASTGLLILSTAVVGSLSWQDASRLGIVAAFPLVAGVLGHSAQNRKVYLMAVEERVQQAEESRDREARRRVAEERVRIARELHDLVAHQIALANAQATVAAHLIDTRPEQTRKSLAELVETTSDALDELRATVGLLRQAGDAAGPTEPAVGLSRLAELLESLRRAGLEVSVDQQGTAAPLLPGVDLTAYRIVQEALTNVIKQADTDRARLSFAWQPDWVTIAVSDDGGDGRATSTTPAKPDDSTEPSRPAPGYGLIGMHERANAVGGKLFAGKCPDGGFLVSVELPLQPPRGAPDLPTADVRTIDVKARDAL